MVIYISDLRPTLLDEVCDRHFMMLNNVKTNELKRLFVGGGANFAHASHFVVDAASMNDDTDEFIDAVMAIRALYKQKPVITIADKEPRGSALLKRLVDKGFYDIVTDLSGGALEQCLLRRLTKEEAAAVIAGVIGVGAPGTAAAEMTAGAVGTANMELADTTTANAGAPGTVAANMATGTAEATAGTADVAADTADVAAGMATANVGAADAAVILIEETTEGEHISANVANTINTTYASNPVNSINTTNAANTTLPSAVNTSNTVPLPVAATVSTAPLLVAATANTAPPPAAIIPAPAPPPIVKEKLLAKRDFRKLRPFLTVAVCGTEPHIGASHHALLITKFLNAIGFKACYLEANPRRNIVYLTDAYAVNVNERRNLIQFEGVDMFFDFKLPDVMASNYDFFVFDFGAFTEMELEPFLTKDVRVIVGGAKAWEIPAYGRILNVIAEARAGVGMTGLSMASMSTAGANMASRRANTDEISGFGGVNFILNHAPPSDMPDLREFVCSVMGNAGAVYFSEYAPYPFDGEANRHIYKGIFSDYVITEQYEAAGVNAAGRVLRDGNAPEPIKRGERGRGVREPPTAPQAAKQPRKLGGFFRRG